MNLRVSTDEQCIHCVIYYASQLISISTKTYPVNLNKQSRHMSNMKHDTRNIYNSGHFAHEQWNDYHLISHFVRDTDTNKLKKFLLYLSKFISATSIYYWQIFKRIMLHLIFFVYHENQEYHEVLYSHFRWHWFIVKPVIVDILETYVIKNVSLKYEAHSNFNFKIVIMAMMMMINWVLIYIWMIK